MQEKKHKLSDYQLKIIDKVKKSKENEQRGNFSILNNLKKVHICSKYCFLDRDIWC
ncbi:MAG: hypothetical protein QG565_1628 [Campylobacterota bacterium]|nr:hypothetical protein [Campylobacterota bacterium]